LEKLASIIAGSFTELRVHSAKQSYKQWIS